MCMFGYQIIYISQICKVSVFESQELLCSSNYERVIIVSPKQILFIPIIQKTGFLENQILFINYYSTTTFNLK